MGVNGLLMGLNEGLVLMCAVVCYGHGVVVHIYFIFFLNFFNISGTKEFGCS